jgi:hypothetical protein
VIVPLLTSTNPPASLVTATALCRALVRLLSETFQVLSVTVWLIDDRKDKLVFAASTALTEDNAQKLSELGVNITGLKAALSAQQYPVDIDESKEAWVEELKRCNPEQFREGVVVHWLDHVSVEPGFFRAAAVLLLTPTGQGHNYQALLPPLFSYPASRFVSVEFGKPDVEQDCVGLELRCRFHCFNAVVGDMGFVAGQLQQQRQAVGRVLVVIYDQDATFYPSRLLDPSWLPRRRHRRFGKDRQTYRELGTLTDTGTAGFHRAVMHFHEVFHQRQADAQPASRPLQQRIDLREHFEDAGQLLGGDADAGVSHPDYGVRALSLDSQPDATVLRSELAGVI